MQKPNSIKMSFKHKDGVSYGIIGGYMTTLRAGNDIAELFISFSIPGGAAFDKIDSVINEAVKLKKCTVESYDLSNTSVLLSFPSCKRVMKNINEFVEYFYPILKSEGVLGTDYCPVCKKKLAKSDSTEKLINKKAYLIHNNCAVKLGLSIQNRTEQQLPELRKNPIDPDAQAEEDKKKNAKKKESIAIFTGVIGAMLGGLIGSVIWAVVYSFGWVVAFVGIVICLLSIKGYFMFGGKFSPSTVPVIFLVVVFSVCWGQILANEIFVTEGLLLKAIQNAPTLNDLPRAFTKYFASEEVRGQLKSLFGFGLLLSAVSSLLFIFTAIVNKNKPAD